MSQRSSTARSRRPRSSSSATSTRTAWSWAWAGAALGGLLAVLLFAPAHWLAERVAAATDGRVQLLQPRGTVWNGSAQLVLTGGAASLDLAALPGRMNWKLRPHWSGVRAQLQADCCTPAPIDIAVHARWGGAQVRIADHQSHWPAPVLAGLGTPWNTLQPQGQLALQTQGLQFDWASGRMAMGGQLQLDALDMSSRLSTLKPMGSYRVLIQGQDVPTLTLSTLNGELQLNGSGRWIGQRLRFTGEARAANPTREAALANLLNIIGQRRGASSIITVG